MLLYSAITVDIIQSEGQFQLVFWFAILCDADRLQQTEVEYSLNKSDTRTAYQRQLWRLRRNTIHHIGGNNHIVENVST